MLKIRPLCWAILSSILLASASSAQVVSAVDSKTVAELKNNFAQNLKIPSDQIDYIGKTDFPGMYLVLTNGFSNAFLTDSRANKVVVGNYIDTQRNNASIVSEIKDKYYKIMPTKFNLQNAIVEKLGTGARKLYLIADVNCYYCKKLETETLSRLNNVTIYTLPVTYLSTTEEKEKQVKTLLCKPESEQAKLWVDLMLNNKGAIGESNCTKINAPMANTETAKKLGISGTPTLIFENGAVHVGAIELSQLEEKLNKNSFKNK